MDLIGEATNGRVLAARHISAEKPHPERNENAINSTVLLCHTYDIEPRFEIYFEALQSYAWVLWTCGLIGLLLTYLMFVINVRSASKHQRSMHNTVIVLAVYPIVATTGFVAIILPRARLMTESLAQEAVMIGLYHLYRLIIEDCGGRDELIRKSEGSDLETRLLPCCCWPCCVLPRPKVQKRSLTAVKCLVLQLPIVQALVYLSVLILWSEDFDLYVVAFPYFQPIIIISILLGIWGINICVKAAEDMGMSPRLKLMVLQAALLIVKLQCAVAKIIAKAVAIPCLVALNPLVVTHMIHNIVLILEMMLISLWAWRLYRVPTGKISTKVQQAVIEDTRPPKEITDYNKLEQK